MKYLLDTCVVSELMSRQPNQRVIAWVNDNDSELLYLSAITIGELQRGMARLPVSQHKRDLAEWIQQDLIVRFQHRLLAIDVDVMLTWGDLVARLEAGGRILPSMDSFIAAIALHHGHTLVTRNERDFAGTGVTVVNPWPTE
ncbi:PIN domain-containing protein [bacterium]|nr:PIN domain-containing protein [bacterium]